MLKDYLIPETELAPIAYWRMMTLPERTAFIIDGEGKLRGFVNPGVFPIFSDSNARLAVGEVCRRDLLGANDRDGALLIAAEYPHIPIVPIVRDGKPVDVLRRWQLFFRQEYLRAVRTTEPLTMPYPQYAAAIWRAAAVAASVDERRMSVIEFGVAQGDGLIACELIAAEISRLSGVEILVYGFDGATGLPEPADWRDCPQCWNRGEFPMDEARLRSRLANARLIIGPLQEICKDFRPEAPIGSMLVDVDFHSSSLPVLKMLDGDNSRFLPIVNMYFDDIGGSLEFQGETLAIKEFNSRNKMRKIAPELESFGEFNFGGRRYGFSKLKACMLYDHPKFTQKGFGRKIMHDFWR